MKELLQKGVKELQVMKVRILFSSSSSSSSSSSPFYGALFCFWRNMTLCSADLCLFGDSIREGGKCFGCIALQRGEGDKEQGG